MTQEQLPLFLQEEESPHPATCECGQCGYELHSAHVILDMGSLQHHQENPCITLYGRGPSGQSCRGCVHLRYPLGRNPNKRHWKCDLRTLTHGSATDHRVTYPSCARYEARTGEPYHGG